VLFVVVLRALGQDLNRTQRELHEPGTRTVTYVVPPGRDPAALRGVLAVEGYRVVEESPDRLLIACPKEDDPGRVRRLLDHACGR
jgi:hypothetical protein